jgi:hypothetical protein
MPNRVPYDQRLLNQMESDSAATMRWLIDRFQQPLLQGARAGADEFGNRLRSFEDPGVLGAGAAAAMSLPVAAGGALEGLFGTGDYMSEGEQPGPGALSRLNTWFEQEAGIPLPIALGAGAVPPLVLPMLAYWARELPDIWGRSWLPQLPELSGEGGGSRQPKQPRKKKRKRPQTKKPRQSKTSTDKLDPEILKALEQLPSV